jgi:hypothetical protein
MQGIPQRRIDAETQKGRRGFTNHVRVGIRNIQTGMIVIKSFLVIIVGLFLVVSAQRATQTPTPNRPPVITKFVSSSPSLMLCPGQADRFFCERSNRKTVTLSVEANDSERDNLTYEYSVSAGEVLGTGATVTWRLTGQPFGTHTATVKVADARGGEATAIVSQRFSSVVFELWNIRSTLSNDIGIKLQ